MKSPKRKRFVGEGAICGLVDKGFGFIRNTDADSELFFHANELLDISFDGLRVGDKVGFDIVAGRVIVPGRKQSLIAVNVVRNGLRDSTIDDEPFESPDDQEVRVTIESATKRLAEIIAMKPGAIESIEWRDLERVIATVFAGLGFDVELTPGGNDGGKDVVVEFSAAKGKSVFLIEVKHWRTSVGSTKVRKFLHVLARSNATGGLILSTNGFSANAIESLTEFERSTLRFGTKQKVVTLCRHFVQANEGTWYPPQNLDQVILDDTI